LAAVALWWGGVGSGRRRPERPAAAAARAPRSGSPRAPSAGWRSP